MVYRGAGSTWTWARPAHNYYVGIMEYIWDGVVYDFIDNQEFFTSGNPYTNLVDDIPKYCFFSKAALAALNYMNWIPTLSTATTGRRLWCPSICAPCSGIPR